LCANIEASLGKLKTGQREVSSLNPLQRLVALPEIEKRRLAVDVIFGQMLGLFASLELGLLPDAPSPSGVISRVVPPRVARKRKRMEFLMTRCILTSRGKHLLGDAWPSRSKSGLLLWR
jgi:hypothetical protein